MDAIIQRLRDIASDLDNSRHACEGRDPNADKLRRIIKQLQKRLKDK